MIDELMADLSMAVMALVISEAELAKWKSPLLAQACNASSFGETSPAVSPRSDVSGLVPSVSAADVASAKERAIA